MTISKEIYNKMKKCSALADKHRKLVNDIEIYLKKIKKVDIERLRNWEGADIYVDFIDYGTTYVSKEDIEDILTKCKLEDS